MPNDATSSHDPIKHDPTHVGAAPRESAERDAGEGELDDAAPKSDEMSGADTANGEGPDPGVTPSP